MFRHRLHRRRSSSRRRSADSRLAPRNSRLTHRRGVLLLVVLSMLVLVLMIGTAFVIVAKQAEQAGKAGYKGSVRTSTNASQTELLDEALRQLVRDTNNPYSAIRGHSLLADMYGADGLKGVIAIPPGLPAPQPAITVTPPGGVTVYPPRWAAPMSARGANPTGGQIIEFDVASQANGAAAIYLLRDLYGNTLDQTGQPLAFANVDDAYNGQVLTFLTGPAAGRSTRIVGFVPPFTFRVMNFELPGGGQVTDPAMLVAADQPTRVLINGRPFNGTGAGFNPWAASGAPKLNVFENVPGVSLGASTFPPLALLPNAAFRIDPSMSSTSVGFPNAVPTNASYFPFAPAAQQAGLYDWNGRGGADESYDAVDFQNMALALLPADGQLVETLMPDVRLTTFPAGLSDAANNRTMMIPSWHRPALLNYWRTQLGQPRGTPLAMTPTMLRKVMLRPSWFDHPRFSGSNPDWAPWADAFAYAIDPDHYNATQAQENSNYLLNRAIYGPWDVDNDNDGVRDSVWIDVGLPVMNGPNGKLVRPLAAMLVVDMDGRLNVNAHGSADLAKVVSNVAASDILADGATQVDDTPRGMGFGPADVSLGEAIGDDNFYWLLTGRYQPGHANQGQPVQLLNGPPVGPGRYGYDSGSRRTAPGWADQYDILSQISLLGWPRWADGLAGGQLATSFVTPPDAKARYGVGVNYFGQPVFEATLQTEIDRANLYKSLAVDSPYELNLSQATAPGVQGYANSNLTGADAPFAVGELERVLRVYDADSGALPGRLAYLSGVLSLNGSVSQGLTDRLKLTTDSFDLPVPNVALPHEMEVLLSAWTDNNNEQPYRRLPRSTAELYEMRVRVALFGNVEQTKFPVPLGGPPNSGDQNKDGLPDAEQVRAVLQGILAPELADGLRMNVNRPLGNGRDDNNNGVVDEPPQILFTDANKNQVVDPGELQITSEETDVWALDPTDPYIAAAGPGADVYKQSATSAKFPHMALDRRPTGTTEQIDHRQLLARHLYVLALTLTADPGYNPLGRANMPPREDKRNGADAIKHDRMLARTLAQWAVNVVDFRDPDNIMTAFEYDPDPFDGWGYYDGSTRPAEYTYVDGLIQTTADHLIPGGDPTKNPEDSCYVWGAERPELLMTETLTWHDRRTDDSAQENPYPPTDTATSTQDKNRPDPDYDQRRRPRGAAFIELYNPWPHSPAANLDTHAAVMANSSRVDMGVNLAAVATGTHPISNKPLNSPVWRMSVYKRPIDPSRYARAREVMNWDPDDLANAPQFGTGNRRRLIEADRTVYFAGFDPEDPRWNPAWGDKDGVAFFNDSRPDKNPVPPVRPGRYLVVGSGDDFNNDGVYENWISDRQNAQNPNDPNSAKPKRRIELATRRAGGLARMHTVRLIDDDDQPFTDPLAGFDVQAPSESNGITQPSFPGDASQSIADVAIIDQVYDRIDGWDPSETGYEQDPSPYFQQPAERRQRTRRFTLSEPAIGYPAKFRGSRWKEDGTKEGQYLDKQGNPAAIDIPLDGPLGGVDETQFDNDYPIPYYLQYTDAARGTIQPSGTKPDPRISYSFIYLQRLANPLLPWNPEPAPGASPTANGHDPTRPVNPYMTVDSTTANLSVYNGRDTEEVDPSFTGGNGYVPVRYARERFASLQRGYYTSQKSTAGTVLPNLFGWEFPSSDRASRPPQNPNQVTLIPPASNLYDKLTTNNSHNFDAVPFHTLGYLNTPFVDPAQANLTGGQDNEAKKVKPRKPFSWFTWNNRPFASANELLLVPKVRPSQVLREFTTAETPPP
ncbi:MAG: hypothetical protein IT424_13185, partial [Pirellulales bacterium]|nr:hypothetical protein [Pirellulales bacterium]